MYPKGCFLVLFQTTALFCWKLVLFDVVRVPLNLKMWLKVEGFVDRVQKWQNGYSFVGLLGFVLAKKLRVLKVDLKKWNKEEFGDLAFRKKNLLTELMGLDAREELLGLSNGEQFHRIQL